MAASLSKAKIKKKSRGRPISFDRAKLIETVMNKFWEHGYEGVSLNEIAQETGLTRASLYNSFGSKEALFREALERYVRIAPDAILEHLNEGESVGDAFFAFFDDACQLRAEDDKSRGCMAVNCINELVASGTQIGDLLREKFNYKKALIKKLLMRAVRQKELPQNTNCEGLSALMMTFMSGFSTYSKTGTSGEDMRQLCELFLNQIGFSRSATP